MGPLPGPDVPSDPVEIALPSPGPPNMGPLPGPDVPADPVQIALPSPGPANMGPLPGPDVHADPVQIALPSPGPANMGPLPTPDPAQIALPLPGAANMGPLPALDPNGEGEVAQAEVADNAFFLASDHFKGAMQHCYFGTGKHGLGYYELKPAIAVLEEHPSLPGTQKWKALPCPKCYTQIPN